jgi:hypothetical protein
MVERRETELRGHLQEQRVERGLDEAQVEEHREETVVEPYAGPGDAARRLEQLVWLVTLVVDGLLLVRLLLRLLGANPGAAFVRFIENITQPLVAPFAGVFQTLEFDYGGVFEPHSVLAIVVYAFLGWLLTRLVRLLLSGERTQVAGSESHRRL